MQADIKTKNRKNLKVKALVDSGCTHTGIDKQLVKEKNIQTKAIDFSFKVFNADGTKNGEVTKVAPLKIEINGHKEKLEAAVTDLAGQRQKDKRHGIGQNGTGQQRNRQGTGQDESQRSTRIYSTIHPFVQQEEIRKITRTERMGS